MRQDDRKYARWAFLFILLAFTASLALSCKKEAPAAKGSSAQGVNPYNSNSVYSEVKGELKKDPNDVEALYHLADLYDREGLYADAIKNYQKVVKLKPGMGYAYFKMATAYDRMNKPAEAIASFRETIKRMPSFAVAYNNMGVAYGKLGKRSEEINALRKAIKLRPNYSAARYNLGFTYLKAGNRKAALRQYEALEKFDSGIADELMEKIKGGS